SHQLRGNSDGVNSLAFAPDRKTLASADWRSDKTIRLWDVISGKERGRLAGSGESLMAFAPDSRILITSSRNQLFRLWDVVIPKEIRSFPGHQRGAAALALSPDGRLLASVANFEQAITLWDVATGRQRRQVKGGAGSLVFSGDGRTLIAGGSDGVIRF